MRILFDQGTLAPLRFFLAKHEVVTAFEAGWSTLSNGDLIAAAEASFDVLVTTDQNLSYQQNLNERKLAIIVLATTSWPRIKSVGVHIADTINRMSPSDYIVFTVE
jgi:hypothetical protein